MIQLLRTTFWNITDSVWEDLDFAGPSWTQVEQAVRSMNFELSPVVALFRSLPEEHPRVADFVILRTTDFWYLEGTATANSTEKLSFYDFSKPDEIITAPIRGVPWRFHRPHTCEDLDLVLESVNYFYRHGKLYPEVDWTPVKNNSM